MTVNYIVPKKDFKNNIRKLNLGSISVGGYNSLPFMHSESNISNKPLVAIEIYLNVPVNYPEILLNTWGNNIYNPVKWAITASNTGADALVIRFNIKEDEDINLEINKSKNILREITALVNIPIIITGTNRQEYDVKLIPELAKATNTGLTFGIIDEDNYKSIIPALIENGHNVIARTPIDINLAKELNILISEMGFDPNKIIIDPNMGALGYGIDYAYSVIERIKLAALQGDNMLNMPIITFVGEETWKTKEAKSDNVPDEWGNKQTRAVSWECITASSIVLAGADIVVVFHPDSVKHLKKFIEKA